MDQQNDPGLGTAVAQPPRGWCVQPLQLLSEPEPGLLHSSPGTQALERSLSFLLLSQPPPPTHILRTCSGPQGTVDAQPGPVQSSFIASWPEIKTLATAATLSCGTWVSALSCVCDHVSSFRNLYGGF